MLGVTLSTLLAAAGQAPDSVWILPLQIAAAVCFVLGGVFLVLDHRRPKSAATTSVLNARDVVVGGTLVQGDYHHGARHQRILSGGDELAGALREWAGTKVVMVALMNDGEAWELATQLKGVLEQAGWTVNGVDTADAQIAGVHLRAPGTTEEEFPPAFRELARELIARGIPTIGVVGYDHLEIRVGWAGPPPAS